MKVTKVWLNEIQHNALKGINPLVYAILQELWRQHGYVSSFTVQTMMRIK